MIFNRFGGKISLFVFIVFLLTCMFFLQHNIDNIKKGYPEFEILFYLPTGKFIKSAVLGFDELAADILYIKAVEYFGGHYVTDKQYKWLYHILDVITTLSPTFIDPYEFGAVLLALEAGEVRNSNELLEKGIEHNPQYWRFPFYLGFNYFFYLDNYEKAAFYMERASKLPERPDYIPYLASRLYAEAKNPDYAVRFLTEIYNATEDKMLKEGIEVRIKELIIERDLNLLERVIKRYVEMYNSVPSNLQFLVKEKLINNIPEEPFGGYYYIEQNTGLPKSSTHPERLRIYRQDGY